MSVRIALASVVLGLSAAAAAQAGPIATGNAAGGAITIVTPAPATTADADAATPILPTAQAPVQQGFIAGYVGGFSR